MHKAQKKSGRRKGKRNAERNKERREYEQKLKGKFFFRHYHKQFVEWIPATVTAELCYLALIFNVQKNDFGVLTFFS